MTSISDKILLELKYKPKWKPIWTKDFLHLGKPSSVSSALHRLSKANRLVKARNGLYFQLINGRFGPMLPDERKMVTALAKETGETVAPNGAEIANNLGFSKHVPMRSIFLTSGRSRKLHFGKLIVEFRHVPKWMLFEPWKPAGDLVRAIGCVGPNDMKYNKEKLKGIVNTGFLAKSDIQSIGNELSKVHGKPKWIINYLSELENA